MVRYGKKRPHICAVRCCITIWHTFSKYGHSCAFFTTFILVAMGIAIHKRSLRKQTSVRFESCLFVLIAILVAIIMELRIYRASVTYSKLLRPPDFDLYRKRTNQSWCDHTAMLQERKALNRSHLAKVCDTSQ